MRKMYTYKTGNKQPVEEFLRNANEKIQHKALFQLSYIRDERNGFYEPYVKHFSIPRYKLFYELRIKAAGFMVRIIFYEKDSDIILLHAFYKRDRKDTEKALETALKIFESACDENGVFKDGCRKEWVLCD